VETLKTEFPKDSASTVIGKDSTAANEYTVAILKTELNAMMTKITGIENDLKKRKDALTGALI